MTCTRNESFKLRVLIADDYETNRDLLSRRLARRGYDVLQAADGETVIAMAVMHSPDVILMDMSMPKMSGWEATSYLKSSPVTRDIPVIAVTSHSMAGDRERALAAGCDAYASKPIDLPGLLDRMESLAQHAAAV